MRGGRVVEPEGEVQGFKMGPERREKGVGVGEGLWAVDEGPEESARGESREDGPEGREGLGRDE